MKNFIIAFCVFVVWSFFGLWIYYWLQDESTLLSSDTAEMTIGDTVPSSPETTVNLDTLTEKIETYSDEKLRAFTLSGETLFAFDQPISIQKNRSEIYIPEATLDFKYKLNAYYIEHPNTELHIKSQYSAEETTGDPNLGVQRAENLKAILTEIGIPESHIVIKPHIRPIPFENDGSYAKAFSFEFVLDSLVPNS